MSDRGDMEDKTCPLCGKENGCMVDHPAECWCMTVMVPPELLEMVPNIKKGKSCICKDCIEQFVRSKKKSLNSEKKTET